MGDPQGAAEAMRLPIAREAIPFALPLALAALGFGLWRPVAAVPPALLLAFVVWFFRDPERATPAVTGAVVSPADGRVIRADGGRISIFLNVFNVHVCRSPLAATIGSWNHVPGRFLAAFKEQASEQNERAELELQAPQAELRVTLVAGLVARRIVRWVEPGQQVAAGQRIGMIRFGSRVDLDLPAGAEPAVRLGDKVVAGVSVIARLPDPEADGSARAFPV